MFTSTNLKEATTPKFTSTYWKEVPTVGNINKQGWINISFNCYIMSVKTFYYWKHKIYQNTRNKIKIFYINIVQMMWTLILKFWLKPLQIRQFLQGSNLEWGHQSSQANLGTNFIYMRTLTLSGSNLSKCFK